MHATKVKSPFLDRLDSVDRAGEPGWLTALRRQGAERFEAEGLPTPRLEAWKYTNLKALGDLRFRPPSGSTALAAGALDSYRFGGCDCVHLVFVNGVFAPELSSTEGLAGEITAGSLNAAREQHAPLPERHLGRLADPELSSLTALNTALFPDGAFVHVPRGVSEKTVIHLLFVTTATDGPVDVHPRTLLVVEESAEISVVEDYLTLGDEAVFVNPVTEIVVGENARLDLHELVRENAAAFHVGMKAIHQARDSRFTSLSVTLGGRLVRNNIRAVLDDEGITCTLNGLAVGNGEQHVDNQTLISHEKPRCESHELYKAILDDRARGVFNGKIYVAQDAQKTDARQANHALLLTEQAEMNAKPELEIYADDVKCTHGATVGQLDADALFYLRSRGLAKAEAENLLTFAFVSDVVEQIQIEPIRHEVERMLFAKLPRAGEIAPDLVTGPDTRS